MTRNLDVLLPGAATHDVFNQSTPLMDWNPATADRALQQGVALYQGDWGLDAINRLGARTGSRANIELGFQANAHRPVFHSHDHFGHRIDQVEYHPAYHALMRMSLEEGIHADAWLTPRAGAQVVRAAKEYLMAQLEPGHGCPLTMTFASVPTLRLTPQVAEQWLPKVLARGYDSRNVSARAKDAVTIGMGMTEKQGGSDVRANTTQARALGPSGPGELYELVGHKWFLSAPMCDAFLMLAQTPEGLSCFLVPRWRMDGTKNPLEVQQLKNKMGNVSNASSEVELRGAHGWLVGEPGRGVPAIIEMVALTRFDCVVGSSALERRAVTEAIHHCRERSAFGRLLIDQPSMQNVLADLHMEQLGALALSLRLAAALDRRQTNAAERHLFRLGTAVGKYWVCKRAPLMIYEAMECLGGNGVMEDGILPRLYREAPVNAIWEGSGNVQALDILRAIHKEPVVLEVWLAEIQAVDHPLLRRAVADIKQLLTATDRGFSARRLADLLALGMQAALLLREQPEAGVHFIRSRLGETGMHQFGCLTDETGLVRLLAEALE